MFLFGSFGREATPIVPTSAADTSLGTHYHTGVMTHFWKSVTAGDEKKAI